MAIDFSGQRVLVTGASSGIGVGLAEEFARRGAIVGICARRRERLDEVLERCRRYSPESRRWVSDLSDPAAVDALAAAALDELGGVDVLVNNAGIPKRRHVSRLDQATVESVMNINLLQPGPADPGPPSPHDRAGQRSDRQHLLGGGHLELAGRVGL